MRISRLDQGKSLFLKAVNDGFIPDLRTIEVMIDGYLRHSDIVRAKDVMKCLESFNLKPNIRIMNLWISFYLKDQQLEKARNLFNALQVEDLTPNATTFLNFIRYYLKNSDFASAMKIKKYMFNQGVMPNTNFYNIILQLLFQKQALAEIDEVLLEMDEYKVKPDLNTFNVMIEGYSSMNMLERAQELLRRMADLEFKPSIVTYNRLLSAQAYSLDIEQTKAILVQMNDLGLEFNAYTYAALFKGLIAKQRYQDAVSMLFRMEQSGVAVPVIVFSDIVKLCCDNNLESAVYLLRTQLVKHDLSSSAHIYSTLIKYYLRHRNYKQVDGLLLEMQRTRNLRPNLHVFSTLLNHFVEHLDFERINSILNHIKTMKLEMNKVIYNVVMKAFYVHCKCLDGGMVYRSDLVVESSNSVSVSLMEPATKRTSVAQIKNAFENTFKIPFKPSIHIFNDLMNNFFYSGRYIEALECFEEVLICDLTPNLSTMTVLIKARLYLGQIEEAKRLIQMIPKYGLKPSTLQCALIHHALCRELQTDEAELFMQEISTIYQIRINYVFYASLIYAYSRRFDHYNVFRTFERLEEAGFKPDTEVCNYVLMSMLEVGHYREADELFRKMIKNGIRRNSYTYAIMTDRHFIQEDPTRLLKYLGDSVLPGNSIDAFSFNKLLRFHYDKSHIEALIQVVETMMECSVRFNWDTWQYVSYLFYRLVDSDQNLNLARKLFEKSLIDLEDSHEIQDSLVTVLQDAYRSRGLDDAQRSLDSFIERLPDIKEKVTQISPTLRSIIESREDRKTECRQYQHKYCAESKAEGPQDEGLKLQEELELLSSHRLEQSGQTGGVKEELDLFYSKFVNK